MFLNYVILYKACPDAYNGSPHRHLTQQGGQNDVFMDAWKSGRYGLVYGNQNIAGRLDHFCSNRHYESFGDDHQAFERQEIVLGLTRLNTLLVSLRISRRRGNLFK